MMTRQASLLLPMAVAALISAGSTGLASPKEIGRFGDWTAFVDGSDAKKMCFIGSSPKKSEGNYTSRGQTYLLVTHRPADKVVGEISVEAGYTFKPGSDVVADIDGKTFKLFTQGGNAWAQDAKVDKAMVQAMRAGKQLIVKGTSSRGTSTTDSYSLVGFTAAFDAISKACPAN